MLAILQRYLTPAKSHMLLVQASSSKLLDVGCGGGLLSLPLARIGYNVTGVDATPEAVSWKWIRVQQ